MLPSRPMCEDRDCFGSLTAMSVDFKTHEGQAGRAANELIIGKNNPFFFPGGIY